MTAQDIYSATISSLPASEQLRLATMILDGLASSADALDYRDHWTEEDLRDVAAFAASYSANSLGEE